MKIALCLSGHYRTFNNCHNSIKNFLLSNYDIDTFFYCWDDSYGNYKPTQLLDFETTGIVDTEDFLSNDDKNFLLEVLKPKKYKFDNQKNMSNLLNVKSKKYEQYCFEYDRPRAAVAMYHTRNEVKKLKNEYEIENNFTYDYVIYGRFDLQYHNTINFIFDDRIHTPHEQSYGIISDIFAYGSNTKMDMYLSINEHLDDLVKISKFNPHHMLKNLLESNNIEYSIEHIPISLSR